MAAALLRRTKPFIGHDKEANHDVKKKNWLQRYKVLSLVDRDSGQVVSCVIDDLKATTIAPIMMENMSREARLMTDEATHYKTIGPAFADHQSVTHTAREYVRASDPTVHTNTVEGYFSIFKRGMKGVYQHCAKKHLHRYLAEYDFRYNHRSAVGIEDGARATFALRSVVGKRLTYRRAN